MEGFVLDYQFGVVREKAADCELIVKSFPSPGSLQLHLGMAVKNKSLIDLPNVHLSK